MIVLKEDYVNSIEEFLPESSLEKLRNKQEFLGKFSSFSFKQKYLNNFIMQK